MAEDVKICRECRYCVSGILDSDCTVFPRRQWQNIVTGEIQESVYPYCWDMRDGPCGKEGKLWEKKLSVFEKVVGYFKKGEA